MLEPIGPDIWHATHHFKVAGMPLSSRMTVVRLQGERLWLHSPVPLTDALKGQLKQLGQVAYIVAPNKMHHLFAGPCSRAYPDALLYGAPGLQHKRPDLPDLRILTPASMPAWQPELDQVFVAGLPFGNETVWFHHPSKTLIVTDFVQWWVGDLPVSTRFFALLTGVRKQLAIPYSIRLLIRDKAATRASARQIMQWPIERVLFAHNGIIDQNARAALQAAFAWLE